MKFFRFDFRIVALTFLGLFFASMVQAQSTRTWVSGVGDDVNPCSRTAPCKTFAGAIPKTAAGGEIDCLDPGGFGPVTITKSITIDCLGNTGGILASGTNGIIINAGVNDSVTIKNMTITGVGNGLIGIRQIAAAAVTVENVRISGFTSAGINVETSTANARLNVINTIISDGTTVNGNGIAISTTGGGFKGAITNSRISKMVGDCLVMNAAGKIAIRGSELTGCAIGVELKIGGANVLIDSSIVSHNATGLKGFAGAIADITDSSFAYNTFGLTVNGGTIQSYTPANNSMVGNLVDGAPTVSKAKI